MRKIIAIVSSLLLLLGVLANIDGTLSFLTRLGVSADKIEKSMEVLTVILKFVLPIVAIYLLFQVLALSRAIKKQNVKLKFYDISYNKRKGHNEGDIYLVKDYDRDLFSPEEQAYLDEIIKEQEALYTIQKGRSNIQGQFT